MTRYWLRRIWLALCWYNGVRGMVEYKVCDRPLSRWHKKGSMRYTERKLILNTPVWSPHFHDIYWHATNPRPWTEIKRAMGLRA